MGLTARYLVDKSVLARANHSAVDLLLRPLLEQGLGATCAIIDLEVLYSAQSHRDYEAIREERLAFEPAPIDEAVLQRALAVQRLLARRGHHRLAIPDLIIAAAAEKCSLVVLHYDADFEVIAKVTKQPQRWIVPRGSI
jgi:predicted nucleic acid-binding protein